MKGIQEKAGKAKLEVALLRIDLPGSARREARAKRILAEQKIDWPDALAGGFDGIMRTFNAHGYGLIAIDAEGIVRGVGVHAEDVEKLLPQLLPKTGK